MNKLSNIIIMLSVLLGGCEYRFTPVAIERLTGLCGDVGVNYYYRVQGDNGYHVRCNNEAEIIVDYKTAQAWRKKDGK